jgi:hypothetical protein
MTVAACCPAIETVVDGAVPYEEQCVREAGHPPPHHCPHGFHWTDDPKMPFDGRCDHCGQLVKLRPADSPAPARDRRRRRARL